MRLFVGVPVPGADHLRALSHGLKETHPDLRLVPDGSWHLTLRFLGEVTSPDSRERLVAALDDTLRGQAALACQVRGLGAFPKPGDARVVWVGLQADGIGRLAERVASATALYGEPPDPRPFQAHVTLGRMKIGGDLSREVHEYKDTVFGTGEMDRVVLFRSELTPKGPVYDEAAAWSLD